MTAFPVTATRQTPGGTGAHLEYNLFLFNTGTLKVTAFIAPSLNFTGNGLKYGISVDSGTVQTVELTTGMTTEDSSDNTWGALVSVNIYKSTTSHSVTAAGAHVLKFWVVDPGVVLEKLVVETTGAKPSYLGPPESMLR